MKTKTQVPQLGYSSSQVSLLEFLAHKEAERISNFTFRSVLSPYIQGLPSAASIVRPTATIAFWRITLTNVPLLRLYQFAYGEGRTFRNLSSIAIETADSLHVMPSKTLTEFREWGTNNSYCYELVVPESRSSEAFQIFRNQLAVLFPQYRIVVENRVLPVLALERTGNVSIKTSSTAKFTDSYDGFTYRFSGGSPLTFVRGLDGLYLSGISRPVVDMTGLDDKIDLTLEANMSNVGELNAALKAYGLALNEKTALIPILVIKDNL